MLPELVAVLHSANPELTAEEIADALWLACYMQNTEVQLNDDGPPVRPADAIIAELIHALSKRTQPSTSTPKQVSSDLYLRPDQKESESGSQIGSLFRSPAASALPNALGLGRALRPFKRRIPSRTAFVLNEEATAKQIAEVDLWLPVLNAALTRWLEIALVVDEGASMVIWRQTIAELRLLLEREGAFRDVRIWGLVTDAADGKTRLYTGTGWDFSNRRECRPNELMDPNGQRLILVITDCVSRGWNKGWDDGSVPHILATWGRSNPIAIIQMLPQRLWIETALNEAVPVLLRVLSPGLPNGRLTTRIAHYWDENETAEGIAVPVVTLEPQSLLAWSRALARAEDVWIPGYKFNMSTPMQVKDEENIDDPWKEEEEPVSAQELIDRFRSMASPMAYKLAELLSAVPLSLPIIRLIQQTLLPESSQIHVAEVFLGGLLEEIHSEQDIVDPDYVEYDFIEGVRELLLASLTVGESLEALSTYVESHIGQARDFYTLLANPLAKEGATIDKGTRSFASIATKVLSGLGGEFASLADWLERVASEPQQAPMEQLLDGRKPVQDSIPETGQAEGQGLVIGESDKVSPEEQRQSILYCNANVIVLGDSGVGKSGLSLVLTGQPFVPTESTHGRQVWVLDKSEAELDAGSKEIHEIQLWDLAGLPAYRLTHQLYLNDASVVLVLFDARRETDPFAGVHYWVNALRQAKRIQGDATPPMKMFLIASRSDISGAGVSRERIDTVMRELGFDGYFETSAKEGWGILELTKAIKQAIDWERLPKLSSTDLFERVREFLVNQKNAGKLLDTVDDLYGMFLKTDQSRLHVQDMEAQFVICIGRVEMQGLIRRLSFGNLVLLQPEILDVYLSALVNAVMDDPDGLGSIAEEKALTGNFSVPRDERLKDTEQEKLLLIAMIEDLLRYEIVLREQADDGPYLVFPSQFTRWNPDLPDPEGKSVIFEFEGPVQNIFATLAVRLSHSGVFKKKEMWKDAVTFTTILGGTCGMFLHNLGEGRAELTLFFEKTINEETRFYFEEYVQIHLKRRAIAERVNRRRIFVCQNCGEPMTDSAVRRRREAGYDWIRCGVCDTKVSILDREERVTPIRQSVVLEMDRSADAQRDLSAAASMLQGKIATGDFDVFLCHHGIDKSHVKKVGELLKEQGILPWLDEWELRPGIPWQRLLEERIGQIKSAAVFVGKNGIGPWQQMELAAFLREFVDRGSPVIPVLLSDAPDEPQLPRFLKGMTWVDFRKQEPDPMKQLIWGITGERERFR